MPNSQHHYRENGTGTGDRGIGVGYEKLGNSFLGFQL